MSGLDIVQGIRLSLPVVTRGEAMLGGAAIEESCLHITVPPSKSNILSARAG